MTAIWIWAGAALAYLLFRAWYDNWRGPLTAAEVDAIMARAEALGTGAVNDLSVIRKFLSEDDGREFFMLNLVKVSGATTDPDTGRPAEGRDLLNRYFRPFVRRLVLRGGHPAIAARKIGGYVDAWKVEPDPGWTMVGYMRYRSRRDMAAIAIDPAFQDIHKFKIAGTAETFSFPTRPAVMLLAGPRIWVALVLALAAALTQIAVT